MKDDRDIRTLCSNCRREYENTSIYRIYRADPKKKTYDDICMKCQKLWGYDCEIIPILWKEERR